MRPMDQRPVNRRNFFRQGLRQLLEPLVEMVEEMNPSPPGPTISVRRAQGGVARGSSAAPTPSPSTSSPVPDAEPESADDPYPPEANP